MYSYYSQNENYVEVTGKISFINFVDESNQIYIAFDEMSYIFSDTCFKLSGKNSDIAKENGIESVLKIGTTVDFVSAPRYFGDGYVMPIVSITINGKCYLESEIGIENLLQMLK